jgi:hypothetical protein
MKNISFSLTAEAISNRTKTVTRRLGWTDLKPGTLLQPVVKGQGLKKGEKVQPIGGPIRVVSVRREPLARVTFAEVAREGFHGMGPSEFVAMFIRTHKCGATTEITRIEFSYEVTE